MQVRVAQLYEDGGRPLPRHLMVTLRPSHYGKLSVVEEYDRELRRSVRSAHLRDTDTGAHVLAPLRDTVLVWAGEGRMTLTGFEADVLTRRCVAQSWFVEVVNAREEGHA